MSDTTTTQPDLDKARDEKCIPIAREILKDMTTDLVPAEVDGKVDQNPLIMGTLKKSLEADLSISTEVPYLFQLILGVLSGLNAAVQKSSPVLVDDEKYSRITTSVLALVSEANVRMGSVTPEESAADFDPIIVKLNDLFKAENLSFIEIKYVMDSLFQAFNRFQDDFNGNLGKSSEQAEAKLFKIDFMSDLTMKKLNDVLLAPQEGAVPSDPSLL